MKEYTVSILTPLGQVFQGQATGLYLKTASGELGILAGHTDYLGSVVPCVATVVRAEEGERHAFCGGGFVSVAGGEVSLIVDEFVFADALSAETLQKDRERLAAQLADCDQKARPEGAEYLRSTLERTEIKLRALEY